MPGADQTENVDDKTKNPPNPEGQHEAGADDGQKPNGEDNPFKSTDEAWAEVKRLRKENAERRTKAKTLEERLGQMEGTFTKLKGALGLEEEEVPPEQAIEQLQYHNAALMTQLGIRDIAAEAGIAPQHVKYFSFLLSEKFEELGEGDELSDEALDEVIAQVQAVSGAKRSNTTGLDDGNRPDPEKETGVTLDQFAAMNVGERSALYVKNPGVYEQLMKEARSKKLI